MTKEMIFTLREQDWRMRAEVKALTIAQWKSKVTDGSSKEKS